MTDTTSLAVLGTGRVGSTIARVAVQAGLSVSVATSGAASRIQLITEVMIPGAVAYDAAGAVATADVVVLAVPLHKFSTVDPALLAGKIVIDVMNYWAPIDGVQPEFEDPELGSSEIVQHRLPGSRVVKTFNHTGYHEIAENGRPAGADDRQAIGVAGYDPEAVGIVAALVERLGFTAVEFPTLAAGRVLEPGGPFFGARLTLPEFEETLADAEAERAAA
jgi:predicted dinucleotide-binding enzyme